MEARVARRFWDPRWTGGGPLGRGVHNPYETDRDGDLLPAIYYPNTLGLRAFELTVIQPKSSEGRTVALVLDDKDARDLMAALKEFLIDNRSRSEVES